MAALVLGLPAAAQDVPPPESGRALGIMGTIPIYWGEAAGLGEILEGEAHRHWARDVLERDFNLVPLDYLSAEALAPHEALLLAQPRALSPEENVALDAWVRRGGRLLLFADPMMTGESRFPLGDRRRPTDVTLLSPILAHWGLEMVFDPAQRPGVSMREIAGQPLPVNLPGTLRPLSAGECMLAGEGVAANCTPGEGEALILADAAMLDFDGPLPQADEALTAILAQFFAPPGEIAGNAVSGVPVAPENHAIPRLSVPSAEQREERSGP